MADAGTYGFGKGTTPAGNPPPGVIWLYYKTDGILYSKTESGLETPAGKVVANTTIYVQTVAAGGSDSKGARGDSSRPFATYAAALAAAQDGDLIEFGPGYFPETVAPVWPVGALNLGIRGAGPVAGTNTPGTMIDWGTLAGGHIAPPATVQSFMLQGVYLKNTAVTPLLLDGTGGAGAYMTGGCLIGETLVYGGSGLSGIYPIVARYVTDLRLRNVTTQSKINQYNIFHTCVVHAFNFKAHNLTHGWDDDSAHKPAYDESVYTSCEIGASGAGGGLYLYGQPWIRTEGDCFFALVQEDGATTPANLTEAVEGLTPILDIHGRGGAIYFEFLPDSTSVATYNFDDYSMDRATGAVFFKRVGVVHGRSSISMMDFGCAESVPFEASNGVDIVVKTTGTPTFTTSGASSGTIKPNQVCLGPFNVAPGNNVLALGFKAPTAPVYVFCQSNQVANKAMIGVLSTTTTTVTVEIPAGTTLPTASLLVMWPV